MTRLTAGLKDLTLLNVEQLFLFYGFTVVSIDWVLHHKGGLLSSCGAEALLLKARLSCCSTCSVGQDIKALTLCISQHLFDVCLFYQFIATEWNYKVVQ